MHRTLSCCISQCLLCLVSSLFSWLVDGVCLPCLAVKRLSAEGSLLKWGGSVCHNPLRPPVNLWTAGSSRLMVCIVSPLCEVCVSNAICNCQCHHSFWEEMSSSSNHCVSESNTNTSYVISGGVRFLLVAVLLNAPWCNSAHNKTNSFWLSIAWPFACYCSDREWTELLSWRWT